MKTLIKTKKLDSYIIKKFLKYFFLVTLLLALICNLVDFLEKFSRNFGSLKAITGFVLLNFIPNFIDLMPIGSYLASLLLIKDLDAKNEWEYTSLIGVSQKKFINLAIVLGLIISLSTFVGKEFVFLKIEKFAQTFKEENLKNNKVKLLSNKWFLIDKNSFIYVDSLNMKNLEGKSLLVFMFDENFELKEKLEYKNFSIDLAKNILQGDFEVISTHNQSKFDKKLIDEKIINFFRSIKNGTNNVIKNLSDHAFKKNVDNDPLAKNELCNLLNRFCSYFNPLIYLIFIFTLFFMCSWTQALKKWLLIFSIYPVMIVLTNFCFFISKQLLMPLLIVYFYGIIIIIGYSLIRYAKKHI